MEKIKIYTATKENYSEIVYIQDLSNEHIISNNNLLSDLKSNNCKYLIAYLGTSPIAYIGSSYACDTLDITSLLVIPSYRKNNVATNLITSLIEFCKINNIKKIFLEVRKSNYVAISLYEKFNFKNISERKNYYKNEDALIYILDL